MKAFDEWFDNYEEPTTCYDDNERYKAGWKTALVWLKNNYHCYGDDMAPCVIWKAIEKELKDVDSN